jgi:RND family efflux transporter MFP subunit
MKRAPLLLLGMLASLAAVAAGYDASVQFARRAEIGVPVSGVVREVTASPGETVARGQVLVRLDELPFRAAVEQAEADIARAGAARTEATRDYKQAKDLYDRTVIAAVEYENAKLKLDRAEAALKDARAKLAQARWALAQSAIAAPFDAWVLEVRTAPGAAVAAALEARTLVVLAAQGEYLARARVPGTVLETLKVGQPASVAVGGRSYTGRVAALGLEPADGKSGEYEVTVSFAARDARLHGGQGARIEFPRGTSD